MCDVNNCKTLPLAVKRLDPAAVLPRYATPGAAGADLCALPVGEPITVCPGETVFVRTGLAMAIPAGTVGLIYARSGMACKQDLAPANKVGVIDSDYRGEFMVALHNHSNVDAAIAGGERIAQLCILPVLQAEFLVAEELGETVRGEGGFGSTGKK